MANNHSENTDIRYEGRDVNTHSVASISFVTIAILFGISLLMIPFCAYMWKHDVSESVTKTPIVNIQAPAVQVEVLPGSELQKYHHEMTREEAEKKIEEAMASALKKGFPVKKS